MNDLLKAELYSTFRKLLTGFDSADDAWQRDEKLTIVPNPSQLSKATVWGNNRFRGIVLFVLFYPVATAGGVCVCVCVCVCVRCAGTKPFLTAVGDTKSVMQSDGCCEGQLKKKTDLEPVQLNYKEIWQGSLKGLLQRLTLVTFIFSMPEVIAVIIKRQLESNLIAFGGIN